MSIELCNNVSRIFRHKKLWCTKTHKKRNNLLKHFVQRNHFSRLVSCRDTWGIAQWQRLLVQHALIRDHSAQIKREGSGMLDPIQTITILIRRKITTNNEKQYSSKVCRCVVETINSIWKASQAIKQAISTAKSDEKTTTLRDIAIVTVQRGSCVI